MKLLLKSQETVENYNEVLTSYKNIYADKTEHIDNLFKEIKSIKKLKL